jgi:hypothetical protein
MSMLTGLPRRAPKHSDILMTLEVDDHGKHRVDRRYLTGLASERVLIGCGLSRMLRRFGAAVCVSRAALPPGSPEGAPRPGPESRRPRTRTAWSRSRPYSATLRAALHSAMFTPTTRCAWRPIKSPARSRRFSTALQADPAPPIVSPSRSSLLSNTRRHEDAKPPPGQSVLDAT